MQLAQVIGTVVSTKKSDSLRGCKLMVVRIQNKDLKTFVEARVAVDTVGAGVGEIVLCVSGAAARNAVAAPASPIDTAIVGIVDTIDVVQIK